MAGEGAETVLRRKAGAGRAAAAAPPARALAQALTRAAEEEMALPLRAASAEEARRTLADLPEMIEDRALLAVLAGPGEALGLMALSPPLLAALVEMQTTGRVGAGGIVPRRPTRTDAALASGFIGRALAAFGAALSGGAEAGWAAGFGYGFFLDDPRPLGILLEDTGYRAFRLTLELGPEGAGRTGGLLLALPAAGRGPRPRSGTGPPAPAGEADGGWAGRWERAVLGAEAALDAVLGRVRMPLSAVLALAPGAEIALPPDALDRLRLEGPDGHPLATARLGQSRGLRAARLTEGAAASVSADPAPAPVAALRPAGAPDPRPEAEELASPALRAAAG